jgi:enoyl-CoA hydratase/carnithine racemase
MAFKMSSVLLYEKDDFGVVTLTLNHPETRNTLTGSGIVQAILQACDEIEHDPSVRVVIFTANGTVFSAGGNVAAMQRRVNPESTSATIRQEYRQGIQRMSMAIHQIEVPTIAAVNGPAIGAGCDLTCMCDIRIASEHATFAESFVKIGIVPGDGGAWFLPRVIGMARAAEMSFTGEAIDAKTALEWGMVSRVVAHEDLLPTAQALARKMAVNSAPAVRMTKRLLREGQQSSLANLLELSAAYQAIAHKTTEHAAAVQSFMERKAARRASETS